MNYIEIFEEIVTIIHNDYSGCLDKKGWDSPDEYRREIIELENQKLLDPQKFVQIVSDYLLDCKDQHLFVKLSNSSSNKMMNVGFKVRRYEDLLYIYEVDRETRVHKGMAIKSLDNITIPELAAIHKRLLMEDKYERQRWEPILKKYKMCEIVDQNDQIIQMDIRLYEPNNKEPEYSIKEINEDTLLMKITDFLNVNAIDRLIKDWEDRLDSCTNLIIDVRVNGGGSDDSYFPLLNYIVDRSCSLVEFAGTDDTAIFNCTHRNFTNKIEPLYEELEKAENEETRKFLQIYIDEWKRNIGKGFVELDFSELAQDIYFQAKGKPEKVIILSDYYCGSSGDQFVEVCKNSKKVTVIGRATMGVTDYSNLAIQTWNNQIELWYPTSRVSKIDNGMGLTGVGVLPDIYIPWTPEHIFEDIDLKKALSLCENVKEI
ncbi:peptidase [Bacillus sp. APMAM]|nr:peptidase [Bacillus sp. APMAM]RTZ54275.1 peptidase [Bacillus sp. SAJ1]